MSASPSIIVGLGNPGEEYTRTRHNIGFMVADALADRYRCPFWKSKFKAQITTASEPAFILMKPMTYMNLSGEAVGEALRFHKSTPEQVIVFHDDLDVAPGQVKIKQGGGSGGHNGLKSLDQHIGQNYWRVRIGIGRPATGAGAVEHSSEPSRQIKGDAVTNYVLGNFAKSDYAWIENLIPALSKNIDLMLGGKTAEYQAKTALKQTL